MTTTMAVFFSPIVYVLIIGTSRRDNDVYTKAINRRSIKKSIGQADATFARREKMKKKKTPRRKKKANTP